MEKKEAQHGKQLNQKIKPYVVLQYLLKFSDENHVQSAADIVAYLQDCEIHAERRSIYSDIREINRIAVMMEDECTIDEAQETLLKDVDGERKLVVYDKHHKGFYVKQRKFDLDDIRLLAECVYAAKFVNEGQAKRLVNVVCEFVSEHQAEKIRHNAFLVDRIKTKSNQVFRSISVINEAMSRKIDGVKHEPEKISFKYLKYTIDNVNQQVERRSGKAYVVSPFMLLISDGNYYLLCYDDSKKAMRTYRVDRMKEIKRTGQAREGQEVFDKIDIRSYTQRVFSMYGGEKKRVTISFISPLLDTMIERFGTSDAQYSKSDDRHYRVTAEVEISDQFYGWLLGFGRRVKLLYPDDAVEKFRQYVDKIKSMYEQ